MMLAVQPRRLLARPKGLLLFAVFTATLYWILLHGSATPQTARWFDKGAGPVQAPLQGDADAQQAPLPATEPSSDENSRRPEAEPKQKTEEERKKEEEDQREEDLREQFDREYAALAKEPGADKIFGQTLNTLDSTKKRSRTILEHLKPAKDKAYFSDHQPYVYNPYPKNDEKTKHQQVPCEGPDGTQTGDIQVFLGQPAEFPEPGFGSYDVLGMDGNLCYERETRLSIYGYKTDNDTSRPFDWDSVRWGQLQEKCAQKNKARFDMQGHSNPYLTTVYSRQNSTALSLSDHVEGSQTHAESPWYNDELKPTGRALRQRNVRDQPKSTKSKQIPGSEARTAVLLRTYTGKSYSDNDQQVIRSLITELSLRTGGQYQVFLFVHVKDTAYAIWDDEATYQYVLDKNVPPEFRDIAVLWNDEATQTMYPKIDPKKATVHVSQWLSVQKFAQEFPEFEYIWNWEIDARVTGHNYDFVEKLATFAKRQPRRGLWERNERYYIPSIHGDYDTKFRKEVERVSGKDTIWGPPKLPFVSPIGPKPPVAKPEDDNYKWGVGEEADLITVAPIFNPINSSWISGNELWGFNDSTHATTDLPRRATIVTHSRVSKRLLDIMHVENLRGNHISSEMVTQTTALLHGLKAVYAPMPVFFDRPWKGKDLAKWFNGGLKGESGGIGSAMGWGREARYRGTTWYYRANPPQRMYLNFMGWEDTDVGGKLWEDDHGRPCLPPMLLHPVKDIEPTEPGYKSESNLPYS
ncbi:glutamate-5-semialdehyde dehydrogenase [Hypoxylon texense]